MARRRRFGQHRVRLLQKTIRMDEMVACILHCRIGAQHRRRIGAVRWRFGQHRVRLLQEE